MRFPPDPEVASIREQLDHPVVDADGHLMEFEPLVTELLREIADGAVARRFEARQAARRRGGQVGTTRAFWATPAEHALDRMTSLLPKLQYDRTEQLGLDYMLLYPSMGVGVLNEPDAELRQALTRALNTYYAESYREYRDRLEPVAVIPLVEPAEAIAELDYAVSTLGLKAIVSSAVVAREHYPDGSPGPWLDTIGHGSIHDYDPFWARCVELGVVPAFHGMGTGWGTRTSRRNYVYNHVGHFAAAQEAACRSLLMGGVPKRFPTLRFSFLEGGVGWACQLYSDLLGHFEKRNKDAVQTYDPHRVDLEGCRELFDQFATGRMVAGREQWEAAMMEGKAAPPLSVSDYDDFDEPLIESPEDIVDIFTRQFSFGCEADDPMNAVAFQHKVLPYGIRLNAMFASDVGHWDVPEMRHVLPEAWELVEDGHLTSADFRDFTYTNVVRMLTAMNPAFFDDTAIAEAAGHESRSARDRVADD